MTQGRQANRAGNTLELAIVATMESKGFQTVTYRQWTKGRDLYGSELLLKNVPFTSIYGHRGKSEFLLLSEKRDLLVRIECKWQQNPGSVDEKLPYLYLNCIEAMPEEDIIIVIDGGGAKAGAIEWLRNAALNKQYMRASSMLKNIQVMSLTEFLTWANNTFR